MKVGTSSAVTTTYDNAGLPVSSSDGTAYGSDPVGDLTKIDRSGTTNDWFYTYDSWGGITKAARTLSGSDVTYSLDALERTLSRTSGGVTSAYTYSGTGGDIAKAVVGTTTTTYAYSPGGSLAYKSGSTLRYYVRDLHGDVVGVTALSSNTQVKGSELYTPWGAPGTRTGELSTTPSQGAYGFQGDLTDALTGQVDMGARYYEPTLGRFGSRDVLFGELTDPVSLNQYVYGADSPVTFADPTGLYPVCHTCTPEEQQQIIHDWAQAMNEHAAATGLSGTTNPQPSFEPPIPSPSPTVPRAGRFAGPRTAPRNPAAVAVCYAGLGAITGMGDIAAAYAIAAPTGPLGEILVTITAAITIGVQIWAIVKVCPEAT